MIAHNDDVRDSTAHLFARVVAAVNSRREELHERLRDRVEERIPDFRFTDAAADARAARLRDDILDAYLDALRTGDVGDLSFHEDLGSSMALAGLPLDHHFEAHRIAYPLLLDVAIEEARRVGAEPIERELIGRHLDHASGVTEAYLNGYVNARDIAAVDTDRNTTALIVALTGAAGEWTPMLTSQAAALGLSPDSPCIGIVLTWDHLDAPMTTETVRRRLNGWLTLSPARPVLTVATAVTGLIALPSPGGIHALTHTLNGAIARLVDGGVGGPRLGLSSTRPAREARELLAEAALAHAASSDSNPIRMFTSLTPFEYLIGSSDPAITRLVSPGVRALYELDDPNDPSCLLVLDTWCSLDGDLRATSSTLHCHPNTILNRLRRIASITKLDARSPRQVVQLLTELAVLRQHDHM